VGYVQYLCRAFLIGQMEAKERLWNKNFIIACMANCLIACSFNLLMPTIPL